MFKTKILIILSGIILSACSTPQYRAEKANCTREWQAKIPAQYQQIIVNKVRYESVPDGNINCYGSAYGGYSTSNCTQGTKQIAIPYMEAQTIDVNKDRRNQQINECTTSSCWSKYGNARCKTKR